MTLPAITVYTRKPCIQCEYTVKQLQQRGIAYVELRLDDHPEIVAEQRQESRELNAPLVHNAATGEWWSGFKIDKIKGLGNR